MRAIDFALGGLALVAGSALVATQPAADDKERTGTASARIETPSRPPPGAIDYERLDARLQRLIERPAMVGLAVGVVENGRITFLKGYGETLVGSGDPVNPNTVFRWASLSKGVAGTMVAKLAEQRKVDLSAPVARYSPTLRLPGGAEQQATVSDLLSHRVGLYRNAYDNKLEEGQPAPRLRMQLAQLNLICPPGTCWSYGNVAFDAASEIVERATGEPYGEALKKRLFDPLGMTSASVTRDGLTKSMSWARPHNAAARDVELTDTYYRVPAAGGVNSDIKDLAVWMLAQMGQIPDVVSANVLQAIHSPMVETPTERRRLRKFLERLGTAWYGFGWRSYDYAGHHIVGHRGGLNGYRSLILFDPKKKSGVVAMWNSNTSQPGGLEFEVMDMIFRLPFRDWLEIDNGRTATDDEEEVTRDVGAGSR